MRELYDVELQKVNSKLILISLLFLALLNSCASWLPDAAKIDIPQGNKLEQKQIDQLKIGLTKEQVLFLLGASLISPNKKNDHWQYLYYITKSGETPLDIKVLDINFQQNKITSFEESKR